MSAARIPLLADHDDRDHHDLNDDNTNSTATSTHQSHRREHPSPTNSSPNLLVNDDYHALGADGASSAVRTSTASRRRDFTDPWREQPSSSSGIDVGSSSRTRQRRELTTSPSSPSSHTQPLLQDHGSSRDGNDSEGLHDDSFMLYESPSTTPGSAQRTGRGFRAVHGDGIDDDDDDVISTSSHSVISTSSMMSMERTRSSRARAEYNATGSGSKARSSSTRSAASSRQSSYRPSPAMSMVSEMRAPLSGSYSRQQTQPQLNVGSPKYRYQPVALRETDGEASMARASPLVRMGTQIERSLLNADHKPSDNSPAGSGGNASSLADSSHASPGNAHLPSHRRRRRLRALRERRRRRRLRKHWLGDIINMLPTSRRAVLWFTVAVLAIGVQLVTRKALATNMHNYRWFLAQFFTFLTFATTALPALWVLRRARHDKSLAAVVNSDARQSGPGSASRVLLQHLERISLRHFVAFAVLDAFAAMLLTVGIGMVPGVVSVLVPHFASPLVFLITSTCAIPFYAPAKDNSAWWARAVGYCVYFTGTMMFVAPQLSSFPTCQSGDGMTHAEYGANLTILFVSCVPLAASAIRKNSFMEDNRMDVYVYSCLVSLFQLVVGFVIAPLILHLQYVDGHLHNGTTLDLSHMMNNVVHGILCVFGHDSESHDTCSDAQPKLAIEMCAYIASTVVSQVALYKLMRVADRDRVGQVAVYVGSALAIFFFLLPTSEHIYAMPDLRFCGKATALAIVGAVLGVAGLLGSQLKQPDAAEEIDVWHCIKDPADTLHPFDP